MGLSKYYETIKFFLLGHPWAFKNLKNFKGEDFGIASLVMNSHCFKILALVFTSGTEPMLEWGGHEKQRMSYSGTFTCLAVMESTVLHYTSMEYYLLWHIPSQSTGASNDYHLYRIFLGKARQALLTRGEKQRMAHLYPLLLSFLTNGVDKTSTYSQLQLWVEDDKCWGRRKKAQSIKQDTEHMKTKKAQKQKQSKPKTKTKQKEKPSTILALQTLEVLIHFFLL